MDALFCGASISSLSGRMVFHFTVRKCPVIEPGVHFCIPLQGKAWGLLEQRQNG
jgi:hypothetical protein